MKLWIVVHEHRHGVDVFPLFQKNEPAWEEMLAAVNEESEFEEETEYLELRGPYELPKEEQE